MATANTKQVDIFINGRNYIINCPENEEDALKRAANDINQFIQNIRKQAPHLPQEELLVLCALTLYERSEQLSQYEADEIQAQAMVGQMLSELKMFA